MVYKVIGLMSGSSMDGLDIAFCTIEETGGQWVYSIDHATCAHFPELWKMQLKNITTADVPTFMKMHTAFGAWMGEQVNTFIDQNNLHHKVHLIASHGHTAFHFPEDKTSVQIGCGAALAATTGITVVSDLRAMDVALGGNGAPIVPIAEKLLFPNHQLFLNLGGICNISYRDNDTYIAYDVCPANRVLNELVASLQKPFDEDGIEASKGNILQEVLAQLNALDYYQKTYPKSLANEMGVEIILPILQNASGVVQDKLRTMVEHIAVQIANQIQKLHTTNTFIEIMITGGGGFNLFLLKIIQEKLSPLGVTIHTPEKNVIDYKESLAMALIGVLRWREEDNVLASVTGANRNSIGGALWMGNQ
jgi:anhydro-N-acetylmuramic acid kinase